MSDSAKGYVGWGYLPEGARFRLKAAVDVKARCGTNRGCQVVGTALQQYGAYVVDTGGWPAFYAENLQGKRVVMIDDSLVRGTTAGPLVKLVREAGASEVHVRITCPPITHACHFGVDMGHDGDLMAARLTVEEMRQHIGADSLAFISVDGMMRAITVDPGDESPGDVEGYCNACFTGRYPMEVAEAQAKLAFEGVLA